MIEKNPNQSVIEHVSSYKCEKISVEGKKGRIHLFEGMVKYCGKGTAEAGYETHDFALKVLVLDDESFVQTETKYIHRNTGKVLKQGTWNSGSVEDVRRIKNNVNLLTKRYQDNIEEERERKNYSRLVKEASKMVGVS